MIPTPPLTCSDPEVVEVEFVPIFCMRDPELSTLNLDVALTCKFSKSPVNPLPAFTAIYVPFVLPLKLLLVDSSFKTASVPDVIFPAGKPDKRNASKLLSKKKLFVAPKLEPDLNWIEPSVVPDTANPPLAVIGTQLITPAEVDCKTDVPVDGVVAGNV